jgi:hypothetical protein
MNCAAIFATNHSRSHLPAKNDTLRVKHTSDFEIKGDGSADNWKSSEWVELPKRNDDGVPYKTMFKMLYSDSGIYCLYRCEDRKITATMKEDFLDLWNEDVVEAFFWPDESETIYFEYEISPLNRELPILVPNNKGKFLGWRPWHYEGNRKTKHAVHINKNGKEVTSWTAEFFIPYSLLTPLNNVPPQKGTFWRANFYRIDHDRGESSWEWQKVTKQTFHDYEIFGKLLFE